MTRVSARAAPRLGGDQVEMRNLAAERARRMADFDAQVLAAVRKLGRCYVVEVAEALGHRRLWPRCKSVLVRLEEAGHLTSELVPASECGSDRSGGVGRRYFTVRPGA